MNILYVVCEGQSENTFVRKLLIPYLGAKSDWKITILPYTVVTSQDKSKGKIYRGGISDYNKLKKDIGKLATNGYPITTMIDYYGLPDNFPGYEDQKRLGTDIEKVRDLEEKFKEDILSSNPILRKDFFIPYIQLHEFEALFFSDLNKIKQFYLSPEEKSAIDQLIETTKDILPEDINSGKETAPSKRLMAAIPYHKGSAIAAPMLEIGIDTIMSKCGHFKEWMDKVEVFCRGTL